MKFKHVLPGAYFKTVRSSGTNTTFLLDTECAVVRLHDGANVTGFFKHDTEVEVITREEAVRMAKEYRSLK